MTDIMWYIIITVIVAYAAFQTWRNTGNTQTEINADDDTGEASKTYSKNYNSERETQIIRNNYVPTDLLTPTELKYYIQLRQALKNYNVEIHYKVRLADIFKVKYHNKYYKRNFARIMAKHTDFLIAAPNTAKPLLAIELDDVSHDKASSVKNDTFKNILYDSSYIKLIRVKVTNIYDFSYICQLLSTYKKINTDNDNTQNVTQPVTDDVLKYYVMLDDQGKKLVHTIVINELDRMTKA